MRINGFIPSESVFNSIGNEKNQADKNESFSSIFKDALDKVNDKQIYADNITDRFIKGEDIEVHEMMLATEEAKMSLQLAVQVRNKVVEAVQELTRMQL